jgi:hypothetical protein
MREIGALLVISVCSMVVSGCDNSSTPRVAPEAPKPTVNQKVGKVLPFREALKNSLSRAKVSPIAG